MTKILMATLLACAILIPAQAQTWTQAMPSTSPSRRYGQAMAYDAAHAQVVMFGGSCVGNNGSINCGTWVWDGSNWTQKTPVNSPSERIGHAMAYDSAHGQVVLFGGSSGGDLSDTWVWDGSNWTQKTPVTSPPPLSGHAMAYDAARGQVVLFGGDKGNNTWVWDGSNWTNKEPATSPPGRSYGAMAYDAVRNQTVLFGGYDGTTLYSDTWLWDGTNWTNRLPLNSPSAREQHAMAFDSAHGGEVVLFGGFNGTTYFGETWVWDGSNWTQSHPLASPSPRGLAPLAYDAGHANMVLFGGYNGSILADTWLFTGPAEIPVSVTPSSGSGAGPQTFTAVYADTNGASDLQVVYLKFSATRSQMAHSCLIGYVQSSNQLLLFNDAGAGTVGSITEGTSATLSNSQCIVSGSGGTVTASGNNLTVPINITFKPAFTGLQEIWGVAQSYSGSQGNGAALLGTWTPELGPVSVSPINGTGLSQTFTVVYQDANGSADLQAVYFDIGGGIGTPHTCFVAYVAATNSLYLFNDASSMALGPVTPGSNSTVSNSQCTLSGLGGAVSRSGSTLTVPFNLTFLAGFTGQRGVFGLAQNYSGAVGGAPALGIWIPAPAAPLGAVSVTPNSGAGLTQTFTALYTDPVGASDLQVVYLDFGQTILAAHSCIVAYVPSSNQLYLFNDNGNGVVAGSPIVAGSNSAPLSNSQCTLSPSGGTATADTNNLNVPFAITFNPSFSATQNIFGMAQAFAGNQSAWKLLGTWTP